MTSFKGRMFSFLLRHRHIFNFKLNPDVFDFNTSIPDYRRKTERGGKFFGKLPDGIKLSEVKIGEVPAEWIIPAHGDTSKVIMYFHGGIYVLGTYRTHRPIVAKFVKGSETAALVFDYRLAPEHPYPAAFDDALAVYRYLLERDTPADNIIFVGDSAGGGLALATMLAIRDTGLPLPSGAVVMSPWTDLTLSGKSYETMADICLSPKGSAEVCSAYYAADHDRTDPGISPLHGNLEGLPPIRIYVGDSEILLDDSISFAEKAKSSGVDIALTIGEGLFHCYPTCAPLFPEAKAAMNEICDFIKARLKVNR